MARCAVAGAVGLAAAGAALASDAAKANLRFVAAPARAFQGKSTTIVVATKAAQYHCSLAVRYSDGAADKALFPSAAAKGRVTWVWQVPQFAAPGAAKLTASCPRAARATRTVTVVGGLIPPKVDVLKQGYSSRVRGNGENVSFGIVLQNRSPNALALNVRVLVNFVLPDNHLIGSQTLTIPVINAGSVYYLGGSSSFFGAPVISRLEIVIDPGGRAKAAAIHIPALANVHLVPDLFDPAWLGSVEGDMIDDHPTLALASSQMSAVIFDGSGNVLGGGTGGGSARLLPGTRAFFKLSGGLDSIPFNKAKSVSLSIIPSYEGVATP